jgi:hypothetical protein
MEDLAVGEKEGGRKGEIRLHSDTRSPGYQEGVGSILVEA